MDERRAGTTPQARAHSADASAVMASVDGLTPARASRGTSSGAADETQGESDVGHDHSEDAREPGDDHGLREEPPDQPSPSGPQGAPNSALAQAVLGAYREEARHVRTCDQEDEADGGEQDPQRSAHVAQQLFGKRSRQRPEILDLSDVRGGATEALRDTAGQRQHLRIDLLSEGVAEHRHPPIILGRGQPAEYRLYSKGLEHVRRRRRHVRPLGLLADAKAARELVHEREALEEL